MEYIQLIATTIIILLIFAFSDFLKKKQEKTIKQMQNEIKQGDKIITYTGLSGIVTEVLEDRVILQTNPADVKLSVEKWAIAGKDDRNIEK